MSGITYFFLAGNLSVCTYAIQHTHVHAHIYQHNTRDRQTDRQRETETWREREREREYNTHLYNVFRLSSLWRCITVDSRYLDLAYLE